MLIDTDSLCQKKDVISIDDFSQEKIMEILSYADRIKKKEIIPNLNGVILATCFFEPSTRTRLSFEAAILKLGGQVIGFSDDNTTSVQKGESLQDTVKMMETYADIIAIRHPLEGAARLAADIAKVPVINAGDGANEHPSQAFLDLFTIWQTQKKLDNLSIAFVGDLKYGRCANTLAKALSHFNARLYFVSSLEFEMPKQVCNQLRDKGIKFSFHRTIKEVISKVDVLYMTRMQKERMTASFETNQEFNNLVLNKDLLNYAKSNLAILHPLPRCSEVPTTIDSSPFAYYFVQAENGLYVRQALLSYVIGNHHG